MSQVPVEAPRMKRGTDETADVVDPDLAYTEWVTTHRIRHLLTRPDTVVLAQVGV